MATFNSFGTSFAQALHDREAERRAKADADAMQARREALPPTAATWASVLSFAELEAMAAIGRIYAANGGVPVAVPRADLATQLATTPEAAEGMLAKLVSVGAVERTERLHAPALYRPASLTNVPKTTQKADAPRRENAQALAGNLGRLRAGLGMR